MFFPPLLLRLPLRISISRTPRRFNMRHFPPLVSQPALSSTIPLPDIPLHNLLLPLKLRLILPLPPISLLLLRTRSPITTTTITIRSPHHHRHQPRHPIPAVLPERQILPQILPAQPGLHPPEVVQHEARVGTRGRRRDGPVLREVGARVQGRVRGRGGEVGGEEGEGFGGGEVGAGVVDGGRVGGRHCSWAVFYLLWSCAASGMVVDVKR